MQTAARKTATISISSDFAILDVKAGREALNRLLNEDGRVVIPVLIHGFITNAWGNDDGVSREFQVEVKRVEVQP
ncbi:hypothetical protein LB545_07595 [Mesorhizobium sp. BR1-1-6]|uniref:hypothetical protein n=1 Tax=Mesorhizobium sp. BR1-1-6 TaxID=2876648 RepID=UPI001CD0F3DD|nr:hypothetical protein [Mesorhizobium sp. BR1-1-6]MBZ9894206.1 hypothetical protein [Mesorhizobium sp. BR1-1-6]